MEFRTFGKTDHPGVLLIPPRDMSWEELYTPLQKLSGSYFLILPVIAPGEDMAGQAEAIERCITDAFAGRIWGAYGLREGGSLLLELAARGRIRIRTVVADAPTSLPVEPLSAFPGSIVYWYGSRDKAAGRLLKPLRDAFPPLRTVKLKKMKAGEQFLAIRPDLMIKRLRRTFGSGRLVRMDTLLDSSADTLWQLITRRDHNAADKLTGAVAVYQKEEDLTLIIEGKSSLSGHWSHLIRLEPLSPGETLCVQQLELAGGALSALSAVRAGKLLKKELRRWMGILDPKPSGRFR